MTYESKHRVYVQRKKAVLRRAESEFRYSVLSAAHLFVYFFFSPDGFLVPVLVKDKRDMV